jgi:hypothetical protein
MPRAVGSKDYVGLVKGLITEAPDFSFPDGATSDELNFLLESSGLRRVKRKGFEILDSLTYVMSTLDTPSEVKYGGTEYWQNADVFVSVFYDTTNLHIQLLSGEDFTVLGSTSFGTTPPTSGRVSMSAMSDYFVVMSGSGSVHTVLEYKEDVPSVTVKLFTLFRRDFELVDDGLALTERPSTLSNNHQYNLLNADWYSTRKNSSSTFVNPVTSFYTESGSTEYPSNADMAKLGMKVDGSGNEVFSRDTLLELPLGNTEAPRGHFIYALNDTDRDARRISLEDGAPSTTVTATVATINL